MYPRANTGGCTKQALGFKEHHAAIKKAGYDVVGMSFDKPKSQGNWKAKYSLPYHLLCDADGEALKAFGAFKAPKNVLRSHVVIGKGGKLVDIRNGISPGDSFAEAVKTITGNK
jgi:thioredoxin-dependent peroxiredoxin